MGLFSFEISILNKSKHRGVCLVAKRRKSTCLRITNSRAMTEATDHRIRTSEDYGVYDDAKTYYTTEARHHTRFGARTRTYSQVLCPMKPEENLYTDVSWRGQNSLMKQFERNGVREPFRRGSHGMNDWYFSYRCPPRHVALTAHASQMKALCRKAVDFLFK